MHIKRTFCQKHYLAAVVSALFFLPLTNVNAITVSVQQGLVDRYLLVLKDTGQSADNFTQFDHPRMTKGLASLLIIKKALVAGGIKDGFEFVINPNTRRGIELVKNGQALLSPLTMLKGEFSDTLLFSSVIIESGDFIKGIYGLASNEALMNISTLAELQELSAVTNSAWEQDIEVLKSLSLQSIHLTPNYDALFKVIYYRNVDFTLLDFSKKIDRPQTYQDIELVPVPNVAIELSQPRHFVVSKKHKDGIKVLKALNKGLLVLREQGLIKKYYQQAKVLRDDLSGWQVLNKSEN